MGNHTRQLSEIVDEIYLEKFHKEFVAMMKYAIRNDYDFSECGGLFRVLNDVYSVVLIEFYGSNTDDAWVACFMLRDTVTSRTFFHHIEYNGSKYDEKTLKYLIDLGYFSKSWSLV